MERRWGFVLPVGALGRGRGSRSVLKRLKNGTVVHDASYFIPFQLDGSEESLLSVLRMVLRPSPADKTPNLKHMQDQVMRGVCYGSAMLLDVRTSHSQIVGPVTYMWRPFARENGILEPEGDLSNSHCFDEESRGSLRRQLWIWIHPSVLDEGLNAINFACERQMHDSGGVVKCCSLEGKIARLDVMGGKSMQSLKNILHPVVNSSMMNEALISSVMSTSNDVPLDSFAGSVLSKVSIIDHAESLHPGAILSMIVRDPREVSLPGAVLSPNKENKLLEEGVVSNADGTSSNVGASPDVGNMLSSMWMHSGRHDLSLSDCRELWDSSHNIDTPLAEDILCMEKHHARIKFFSLDSGNDQGQTTQERNSCKPSCPVVLLKHAKEGMLTPGWSLILPLSWVKPFWLFLISHGAHAIGLRERRWIATKLKLPCFPYDYPDTEAYSSLLTKEAAIVDKEVQRRPASKRPPSVPVPPLWCCIMACFNKDGSIIRGLGIDDLLLDTTELPRSSTINSKSGDEALLEANVVASLKLFVPRTIQMLRRYLKNFDMKYLTSCNKETGTGGPDLPSKCTPKMACSMNELCLTTRVLIRALKEGSFEEGAVVCAPHPSDLSAWKIRSEEEEDEFVERWELQLPQSNITSYFSGLDPSTSNSPLPKDDAIPESFRWPIGFVTTGFVHGSGRNAFAVAFCEARLLAVLRRNQWTHENLQTPEICVLVRNVRSAAYRRALATIVLEHQDADLEFL